MIRLFVSGFVFGTVMGAAAVSCWALAAAQKLHREEEKSEKPEESENPLDITPQLAAGAVNIVHEYCKQRNDCEGCVLFDTCDDYFGIEPKRWTELEERNVQKQ